MNRKRRPGERVPHDEVFPGSQYTRDETEFMLALDRYKRERCRPRPTWAEVLMVAKALGYRKVQGGES